MKEFDLTNQIGIFLIVSQFILVIIVFILHLQGGFNFDEMTTTIGLMFPMLSIYTTGILKFFVSHKNTQSTSSKNVTKQFRFIAWFFPGLFVFSLTSLILLKAFNSFATFGDFKNLLALIEGLFGGFTGYIVSVLLEK